MKHMKITNPRIRYLTMFLFLLLTELFIGIFVHDRFIRPYAGDVLVVILIYTFLRALFPHGVKTLSGMCCSLPSALKFFNISISAGCLGWSITGLQ